MELPAIQTLSSRLRYDILRMTHRAKSGHPTSSFSAVDLAAVLFFRYFRFDLDHPDNPANDRLIFSKGHASALYYSLFAAAGKISDKELLTYRDFGSPLEGHPTWRFPFTEAATGSLGQGMSIGVGEALALKARYQVDNGKLTVDSETVDKTQATIVNSSLSTLHSSSSTVHSPLSTTSQVYVLLGDGELAEGSVWEALNYGSYQKLHNIVAIVDVNRFGQSDETMFGHNAERYARRFEAFGWGTIIIDGHNYKEIDAAYDKAAIHKAGPVAIIARTIKGKGVPYWEDKNGWHNKMLPQEEYDKAIALFEKELDTSLVGEVKKPEDIVENSYAQDDENFFDQQGAEVARSNSRVLRSSADASAPSAQGSNLSELPARVASAYPRPLRPASMIEYADLVATKKAFGNALKRIGASEERLVVLDGDMNNSTETDIFKQEFPDRFYQTFIAEQNMVGVAVGMAKRGLIPVVSTFASFLTRAHDQIRMIPLSGVPVIFNGSYCGCSMGKDGPSQMGLEDIAMFRSIFGSVVLYPSDPYQTEKLMEQMVLRVQQSTINLPRRQAGNHQSSIYYLRTTREPLPVLYHQDDGFEIGGSHVFYSSSEESSTNREVSLGSSRHKDQGSNNKEIVTLISAGITLHESLKAQKQLLEEGIAVRVIDCYSIKPIDVTTLKKAAAETQAIVVVEDHYPEGGLGEAVKSALNDSPRVPIFHLAVHKQPMSGLPYELLDYEGICAADIADTVRAFVKSR